MNYSIFTKILSPAGILLIIPLVYRYNLIRKSTGKPVSAAQTLWLAYLLYVYLILTPILSFDESIPSANLTSIRFFAILVYVRAALQYVLMYWVKKWSPLIGFSYNIFCMFQFSYLYNTYSNAFLSEASTYHSSSLFLLILFSCLLVDSLYSIIAYRSGGMDKRLTVALNAFFYLALLLFLGSFYI